MHKYISLIVSLVFLTACTHPQDQQRVFYVFGTTVEVILRDTDEVLASEAFGKLQQRFQAMHRDLHAWEPGQLTDLNHAFAQGRTVDVPNDIAILIRRSQALEKKTGGRFNPAIGGLISLWGFHTSDYPITGPVPAQTEIQSWLEKKPSSLNIQFDAQQASSRNPAVQLDFGGIAKGYAVDIACQILIDMGVESAIVNAGGDLRAYGDGKKPWKIAVSRPGGGVIGSIIITGDEAIFTSGNSHRFHQDQNNRYTHILNPASGWPVAGLSAVTVIADEGILADAAATALMVAGEKDWQKAAMALGLDSILIVDDEGNLYMTESMNKRLSLTPESKHGIKINIVP